MAQTSVYHPVPDTNTFWKTTGVWLFQGPPPAAGYSEFTVYTEGDTTINGLAYTKLYEGGWSMGPTGPIVYGFHFYDGAFREDTIARQIYFVPWSDTTEKLLYDFSLNIGDTLTSTYNYGDNNTIFDIDSVLVGSNYHKRFLLGQMGWNGNTTPDTSYSLIEGVGSTTGFLGMIERPFENFTTLECFTHDADHYPAWVACPIDVGMEEQVGKSSEAVYPNPVSDELTVMLPQNTKAATLIELLDLSGKDIFRVNTKETHTRLPVSDLPAGVYIVKITTTLNEISYSKVVKL
jgi:hypothetical protein